jgi:hypothetical protein
MVILQLDTSAYHGLNEVGTLIWEFLEEAMEVDQLFLRVAAHFEDRPESLGVDLTEFLEQLAQRDLVLFEPAG